MKIALKLTDSGLRIGQPTITLQHSSGNSGSLVDKGFDFLLQDDPTFQFGNYIFTNRIRWPKKLRCGINIPCLTVYDKNGNSNTPRDWIWTDSNSTDIACWSPRNFEQLLTPFYGWNNDHVYLWKPRGSETSCVLLTNTGLSGVPTQVKESWTSASYLVRLTLKWPIVLGSNNVTTWTTGPIRINGDILALDTITYPIFHSMGFHSWGIKTLSRTNAMSTDGPAYATALTASEKSRQGTTPTVSGSFINVPSSRTMAWKEAVFYYSINGMRTIDTVRASGLITHTEAGFFFEGSDRDFAITPIITNPEGTLNLVAMDNQLNTTKYSASKLLSEIFTSDRPVDPEDPLPSLPNVESLFVKI